MVVDAGLPLSFWAEAVNTACYTQKRSIIVKRHGKTAYEVLKGQSPDISYFHAFGCACFILKQGEQQSKFEAKSNDGIFLGYSAVSKAFRIFNVNKRKHSVLEELLSPISSSPVESCPVPTVLSSTDDPSSSFSADMTPHESHSPNDLSPGPSASPEAHSDVSAPLINVKYEEPSHSQHIPTVKDHPITQVIGDVTSGVRTRRQVSSSFCLYVNFVSLVEPKKMDDTLLDADWIKAMQDELHEFERHKVWTLVPLPQGKTITGTRWVFRNKMDEDGIVIRNKARLVAQGFTQMEGLDFYLKQPPGFCNDAFPDHVYRLEKAVYGLKQAPRAWYDTLGSYHLGKGYHRGAIDNTPFIKRSGDDIILAQVYVDDIIFGSTNDKLSEEFAAVMSSKFETSMMGEPSFFLGLQVKQSSHAIFISQSKYLQDMLKEFSFSKCKPAKTPMSSLVSLCADPTGVDVNASSYRGMIASLLYLTASHPDIVFATNMCTRFQAKPKESHLNAVKRIFRYLKHTTSLGLWYSCESSFDLVGFTDSDFAGCSLDRKSTSGGCQLLGNRLISWSSKKQSSVACSTAEAKYVAVGRCCAQVLWIQNQLIDYGFSLTRTPICCDNTSAILISQNLVQHSKTKHIDVRHHFIRDIIQKENIELLYILIEQQLADIFTKPLDE
ncbi:hypothetical protein L2E82_17097 [Cichorium intybus]|uniref:Uncharacterized protein n=1 Tax=Cichorium intybus TaxID=13427 RepID=A0ACB9F7T5_CICIN|nr:hypothetical protein L2E82_17097 [Cichorium intybus]